MQWCWVNFQSRGVLLIWIKVGQGPIALVVGEGGGCLDIFSLNCQFSLLSPSLWETTRYRLQYCLKGPLSPKTTKQHSIVDANLEEFLFQTSKLVVPKVVSLFKHGQKKKDVPIHLKKLSVFHPLYTG